MYLIIRSTVREYVFSITPIESQIIIAWASAGYKITHEFLAGLGLDVSGDILGAQVSSDMEWED